MAIAAGTATGTNSENTSASTFGLGSVASAVGEFIILVLATDNITTTDTQSNNHTSITGGDVTWTKVGEFTNGNAAANAGATVSMWISSACVSTNTSLGTANLSGAVAAKAYTLNGFTVGAGNTLQPNAAAIQTLATDAADPASMTLGSLANQEHLWVRGIASETNSDTAPTPTSTWTILTNNISSSSTGGGAAANMAALGERLIATATTATSNPTHVAADNANILAAFDEVTPAGVVIPHVSMARTRT